MFVEVYNQTKKGIYSTVPFRSGTTWVLSKHNTLEGLRSDELAKLAILRRMKSKGTVKGSERVVIKEIIGTKATNVNTSNG